MKSVLGCVCARFHNVTQDVVSCSLTHTHHAFCVSLNNSACSFSEKPCCAVLRGAFVMRCNLSVCSYHLRFNRRGDTYFFSSSRQTSLCPISSSVPPSSTLLTAPFYIFISYLQPPSALLPVCLSSHFAFSIST